MKNKILHVATFSLGLGLQPMMALSNLPVSSQAQPHKCEAPEPSATESNECSGLHTYVLPIIGGVFGTVLASGIFVLLELRWYLRE